jgi:hypothetical protein
MRDKEHRKFVPRQPTHGLRYKHCFPLLYIRGVMPVMIADIRSTLRLHTWILSFNTALIVAIVGKLFFTH